MERFGDTDEPLIALGPKGEVDGIWYVLLVYAAAIGYSLIYRVYQ